MALAAQAPRMSVTIVDGDCPRCGASKMPDGYPGGRTFTDHYFNDCEESDW